MTEAQTPLIPPALLRPASQTRAMRRKRQCQIGAFAIVIFVTTSALLFFAAMYDRPRHDLTPQGASQAEHLVKGNASKGSSTGKHTKPETNIDEDDGKNRYPDKPNGAKVVQLRPCDGTSASVPLLVSEATWSGSNATSAYITQHGAANDPHKYFDYMHSIAGDDAITVAPGLFKTDVSPAPETYYVPERNLAWRSSGVSWPAGQDAVSPTDGERALNGAACSSYDVYDALLGRFADKERYPNLKSVYLLGHSGGANIVSRYSQVHDDKYSDFYHIRYIVANAAHQAYFTDARPTTRNDDCPAAYRWPYQFASPKKMPRYVRTRFDMAARAGAAARKRQEPTSQHDLTGAQALFNRWMQRDVVLLVGADDTSGGSSQTCSRRSQGGSARRDRNYAYWAMQNLVGQTGVDVSDFHGYETLKKQGAGDPEQWRSQRDQPGRVGSGRGVARAMSKLAARASTAHQICVVNGVGHMPKQVYDSECGRSALRGETHMASRVAIKP